MKRHVFVVQNRDGTLLAIFNKRKKADALVRDVGKKIWEEEWVINKIKLNLIEDWMYRRIL